MGLLVKIHATLVVNLGQLPYPLLTLIYIRFFDSIKEM